MEARKIYGLIDGRISSDNFWYLMNQAGEQNELIQALAEQCEKHRIKSEERYKQFKAIAKRLLQLNEVFKSDALYSLILRYMDVQEVIAHKVKHRVPLTEQEIKWINDGYPDEQKHRLRIIHDVEFEQE